jgi:hypothetical protein
MPSGSEPDKGAPARHSDDELITEPYRGVAKPAATAYHRW